jgi:cytochrome P450
MKCQSGVTMVNGVATLTNRPAEAKLNGLRMLARLSSDRLALVLNLSRNYGDMVHFRLGPFRHAYFLNHPDFIREVLITKPEKFFKGPGLKRNTRNTIGQGLLTSEGDWHKRQRKLIQPAFHAMRITAYGQVMVSYAQQLMARWRDAQTFDMHHAMMTLTRDIVAKTLFDADVSEEGEVIAEAITLGIETLNRRVINPLYLPDWAPTPGNRKRRAAGELLDRVIMGMIEQRRAAGEDRGDLLSMLVLSVDDSGAMSTKQAHDEALTLFVAGHETTANALSWTWYLLSQHPEVEANLHAELASVLGGRAPTVADLERLPYTEMVVKESLRLYPPAWIQSREAAADVEIGGVTIPKGSILLMSQYAMHHSARYFDDPERFIPERWTVEFEKRLPKGAYFPFGGGPRVCIGQAFAMMEARLILATIAQQYRLELVPGQVVEPEPLITLRPKNGLQMRTIRR